MIFHAIQTGVREYASAKSVLEKAVQVSQPQLSGITNLCASGYGFSAGAIAGGLASLAGAVYVRASCSEIYALPEATSQQLFAYGMCTLATVPLALAGVKLREMCEQGKNAIVQAQVCREKVKAALASGNLLESLASAVQPTKPVSARTLDHLSVINEGIAVCAELLPPSRAYLFESVASMRKSVIGGASKYVSLLCASASAALKKMPVSAFARLLF